MAATFLNMPPLGLGTLVTSPPEAEKREENALAKKWLRGQGMDPTHTALTITTTTAAATIRANIY